MRVPTFSKCETFSMLRFLDGQAYYVQVQTWGDKDAKNQGCNDQEPHDEMRNWPDRTFKRLSFIGKSQVSSNNNLHYIEHYMCIKHLTVDINPLLTLSPK